MSKATGDMTKAELALCLADGREEAAKWYRDHMTKSQLVQQVEVHRGERKPEELTDTCNG